VQPLDNRAEDARRLIIVASSHHHGAYDASAGTKLFH
jgi:hypothetical protein